MDSSMSRTRIPVYTNRKGKGVTEGEKCGAFIMCRNRPASDVERAKSRGAVRSAMARVLFSASMDAERRAVVAAKAPGAFDPVILEDVPSTQQAAAWESAEVLVCTGFGSELPPDLASRAPRLRMIQVLVAGVDHMPFDRLRAVRSCAATRAPTTCLWRSMRWPSCSRPRRTSPPGPTRAAAGSSTKL